VIDLRWELGDLRNEAEDVCEEALWGA
jgi:hypothetical protein